MNRAVRDAVAKITGQPVQGATLRGSIWVLELADGCTVVAKHGKPGQVQAEAAGLRWLRVPGGPPVPQVHGHDETWLVTEYVPAGRLDGAAAERLGHQLAVLHAAGAPGFGATPPGGPLQAWIGNAPMTNLPAQPGSQPARSHQGESQQGESQQGGSPQGESHRPGSRPARWSQWYAEHRVLPYLRTAADQGAIDDVGIRVIHRVCERIEELAGPDEPPARLHGDLWSGNVHAGADGQAWLLDPAAHGGHRETDLAMLALFGHSHLDRVLGGYQETASLASGWQARVPLHQLFPLLVHTVLFGGGYGAQATAAARAVLG